MAGDNQQFCLRWNNHQSTLISVFDSLLESGTLVDCTLAAEGQYLKAHKVVLSACSPYLELLLSQHYEKHPIVILKDVKFQELKSMMDYMYRGEVNITQDQLATFLKAAESLQIKGLSESSGSTDDARDVGSTAKRPREEPPPRRPVPPHPQARLPHSSGLTIEPRRSIPHSSEMAPASPMKSREGSTSPVARKRRRRRPSGGDDASNAALSDSQLDTSNSCDLPPVSNQAQSTPISVPSILATPSASNNQSESDQPLETEALSRFPNTTGSELMVKTKMEPNTDQLIEPKTEYLEDINNEDSVEDLTLDDDDEMPGPSHADGSNQNFSQWQMAGDRSTDEVFMAAQEAVGAHRDSQGKDGIASSDNTPDTFTASLRGQLGHFLNDVSGSSDNAFAGDDPGFGNMAGPSEQGMEEVNYLDVTNMSESFNSMTWTSCLQDPLNPETAQSYSEKLGKHLAAADDGQIVLKYYSDHGTLSDHCRSKLCDIIIREEFKNSDRYKIDSRVFGIASKAICLLFPGEVPEIYYIPYENLGYKRKVNAKGKLVEKYNNRRSSLRAVGLLPPVKRQKASSQDAPVASSAESPGENIEYGEDISWLQEHGERGPLELFNAKWKATYAIRRKMILSSSSAKVYLDKFSVFKNPIRAAQLILEDFKTQYPAEANNFLPTWHHVSRKIFHAAERKADADRTWRYSILKHGIDLHRIKFAGNISISAFKILLFLLPQPGFAKKYWRPSRMESYESIFLEVDSYKSYKEMLSRRKEKLSAVGLRVQPLVVVLKKDDGGVSTFVTIDDYELKCGNVLDAFDLCFKLIHVLNLDYPAEAQSAYLFMQKYCLKIQPKEPRILHSVDALAASLGL